MRTTIATIILLLGVSACGSTPASFVRSQARIGCRTLKKCDKFAWVEADHGSVGKCVDDAVDGGIDDFVDACDDFDAAAARKCLRGMRKIKRSCDPEAASDSQQEACQDVCGGGGYRSWEEGELSEALARIEPPTIHRRRVFAPRVAARLSS